ncbi:MAG: efflux RND transporter periplasmic adaptor subunit [Bacteroidia bacterium]
MKRLLLIGGALVVILVLVVMFKGSKGSELEVATEKAAKRDITELVSASGKIQPETEVKIGSDVSGEIVELLIKEGDTVRKGDLLLRINPDLYKSSLDRAQATLNNSRAGLASSMARLEQAKAQFANSESSFNRNKKLFDQSAISASEFDAAKANYGSAKAEVDAANETVRSGQFNVNSMEASVREASDNLRKTSIYAPVSGTVSKLSKRIGERVLGTVQMAGDVILVIANLNGMEVLVDVNENDILRVHLNDTALIEVDAHDNRKFKGIVTEVSNSANTSGMSADQVTNFQVHIRILRDSYQDLIDPKMPERYAFLPGMSATVDIQTKSVKGVVSVPIQSVTTRTDTAVKKDKAGVKIETSSDKQNEGQPELVKKDVRNKDAQTKAPEPIECVFVYRDGKAKLIAVKTGIQDAEYIEIISGLKDGDEIIAAPYSAIRTHLSNGKSVKKVAKEDLSKTEDD